MPAPMSSDLNVIIRGPEDDLGEPGEHLYWSNDSGWGHRDSATTFTIGDLVNYGIVGEATGLDFVK